MENKKSKQQIPTTNVPLEIRNSINNIDKSYNDDIFLQRFQYVIKEYYIKNDTRGILLYHTVGSGKSITAAAISEAYRKIDPKRNIIVLLSKSLQENFKGNIRKYIRTEINASKDRNEKSIKFSDIDSIIDEKYKFISLNASNMFSQFVNINRSKEEIEFEKNIGEFNKHLNTINKRFLENSILIVDEAHNLCNGIKNGSKNSIQLYNTIMNTKNIKLLFLTGTPIIDTPFILVPLFNMLKGYITVNYKKHTLFPENMQEFYSIFVDRKDKVLLKDEIIDKTPEIKNKSIFQNRITGLVSYYGTYYFGESRQEGFPEIKPLIVEKVKMSDEQLNRYMEMRSIEEKEEESVFRKPRTQGFEIKDEDSVSSYKIRSRQVSNFLIPPYAVNEVYVEGRPKIEKNIYSIKDADLKNLDKYSPKFKKIIENLEQYPNQISVIYSEFVNGEGIILFSKVLEVREKYVYWHKTSAEINEFDLEFTKKKSDKQQKTYALIHGDVPFVERERIIKAFNSKQNINGDIISVLLISKSGAEGLSLRHVRSIHIMEPFWNYARIEQIIARGARYKSHENLPENERTIQPYIYISVIDLKNIKQESRKMITEFEVKEKRTTDEELYKHSIESRNLKTQFEKAMIESSIDCSFNKDIFKIDELTCHLCLPNNKPLYSTEILNDLKYNPCKPFKEKQIDLKKVKLPNDDKTYYYVRNGYDITVYEYDETIDKYVEMKKNDSKYSEITLFLLQD